MEHEIRSLKGELRAAPGFKLEGLAARYGTLSSDLGGFIETIAPGAFKRSLDAGAKVVVTKNHDPNFVLGTTKAGTAKVFDSSEGLRFTVQLDASNTVHADTYNSVKRGDLDSCSFAFRCVPGGDSITETKDGKGRPIALRTLKDVDLVDVSVVCYPAYPQGTQVDARSLTAKGLLRVVPRSVQPTPAAPPAAARRLSEEQLAASQGMTVAQLHAREHEIRVDRATALGRAIAQDADADLRARAAHWGRVIAADAEQDTRDEDLRRRMENAAGRTCR